MPLAGPWLEYVFSMHMREALRQEVVTAEQLATGQMGGRDTAVAFADLVGFTELGETIPSEELGSVAGRLSRLAEEAIEPPVQIVKEIGDAVMLVSPEPDRWWSPRCGSSRPPTAPRASRRSGPASPTARPSTGGATGTARPSTSPAG